MKRIGFFYGVLAALALAAGGPLTSLEEASVAASPQGFKFERLYSHVSARGYRLYKLGASLPPGLGDGPWKNEGPVCIVAGEPAPGLKPVYQLSNANGGVVRYDYTTNAGHVKKATSGVTAGDRWTDAGVAFYVAAAQLPETVPLYKLHSKEGVLAVGPDAGKLAPGSGATVLTLDAGVRAKLLDAGWVGGQIVGYVWAKAPAAALPDLRVEKTTVQGASVVAHVRNAGKASAPESGAQIVLLDAAGKTVFSYVAKVGVMFPGQPSTVTFETGGRDLRGLRYRVRLDPGGLVKESDESNNETEPAEFPRPRISPGAVEPPRVPPPAITITTIERRIPERPSARRYRLSVSNASSYDASMFGSLKGKLPPNPCGPGMTDARMLARFTVVRDGSALNAGCTPLGGPNDLEVLAFDSAQPLADTDRVVVTLVDRADGSKYESQPYAVGWAGLGQQLAPAGCKYHLGRQGSFLCTTDEGMSACEAQRRQGKPILCTRAGKRQD